MKKITLTIPALVCALGCAFGLAACGGDDDNDNEKAHTAQQWEAAFTAAISGETANFEYEEGYYSQDDKGREKYERLQRGRVYRDDTISVYHREEKRSSNKEYDQYLIKKGNGYYDTDLVDNSDSGRLIGKKVSAESFATAETQLQKSYNFIPVIFEKLKASYDDFKMTGNSTSTFTDDSGAMITVNSSCYLAENYKFTTPDDTPSGMQNVEYTIKKVSIAITDQGELYSVEIDHMSGAQSGEQGASDLKMTYYLRFDEYDDWTYDVMLPEMADKKFYLYAMTVSDPTHQQYADQMKESNDNKTVTFKNDGTITGNMVFTGAPMSSYTWKEEGDTITVSNETNNDVPSEQRNTLTGGMRLSEDKDCFELVLSLDMPTGETTSVTYTCIFRYSYD